MMRQGGAQLNRGLEMEKPPNEEVAVISVPFPSQSHLNQLLHLSNLIASYGLPVHFIGSATHNRQAKRRANGLIPSKINFHDFPTPPIDSPDPDPNAFNKLPIQMGPAIIAYSNFQQPLHEFLQELSTKKRRLIIIHDRLMAEAVGDAVSIPNVEFYAFSSMSAFNMFYILWEFMEKPFDILEERLPDTMLSIKKIFMEPIFEFIANRPEHFKQRAGDIYNSTRLIEGKYLDYLTREEIGGKNRLWAINPTFPVKFDAIHKTSKHKCLEWLDKQGSRSVLYVSFGNCVSISDEEAREIAMGLEQSKVKFLWVVRDADRADIFVKEARKIELPEGFEERVGENGMVVRDWAPQLEILAHKSVGGFLSHCGWNSCMESIAMGVPVAAWPIHSDQTLNAFYWTEILKVGMIVRKWEERNEIVKAERIKNVVEKLMGSEEGCNMRKRAEELSDVLNKSVEEGGEFWKEMESFIAHITR